MTKRLVLACTACLVVLSGWLIWTHERAPRRPEYALINKTSRHDFDLAFMMSLKLAEKKSGIENALVFLASLPPSKSIEETAAEYTQQLQVGRRRNGKGILYLYAEKENLLKIEVSYALEGDIPDAFCRRLEEAAKTYMLSEVPQDFISELIITTNLRGMGSRSEAAPLSRPTWLKSDFLSGGAGALAPGYRKTLEDYQRAIRRLPESDWDRFLPSKDADEAVRRYLASLAEGIGDPRLPLVTEGSQIFRAVVPRNEAQQRRIAEFFESAAPYRLIFAGNLGLAIPQPEKSNLPIVLRRGTDALWYVDEPKSWTYFHRFEDNVNFFVKYEDNPFLRALRALGLPNMTRAIYGNHTHTPAMPAYPFSLARAVTVHEQNIHEAPKVAVNYAALGDLYLFEMNWLTKATELYEKAAALAPNELGYRWRLVDLYLNGSRADKFLRELKFLSERLLDDNETRNLYQFYKKEYDFGS